MLEIGNGPGQLAPSASTIKGRHGIDRAAGRKWRERKQRGRSKNKRLRQAVHRHKPISKQGIQERLFTLAFSGLVYPQIWEDPLVDLEALALREDKHLVAIASGGCNILSYVATCPIRITAVDLNPSHVALNKLKLAAIRHLPDYRALHRFFAEADARENLHAYEDYVRPYLDETSRRYWEARDLFGRRRISYFRTCLYRHGLLGNFIGASHLLTRLHGRNPRKILAAKSLEEQRKSSRAISHLYSKSGTSVGYLTGPPPCSDLVSRHPSSKF